MSDLLARATGRKRKTFKSKYKRYATIRSRRSKTRRKVRTNRSIKSKRDTKKSQFN